MGSEIQHSGASFSTEPPMSKASSTGSAEEIPYALYSAMYTCTCTPHAYRLERAKSLADVTLHRYILHRQYSTVGYVQYVSSLGWTTTRAVLETLRYSPGHEAA